MPAWTPQIAAASPASLVPEAGLGFFVAFGIVPLALAIVAFALLVVFRRRVAGDVRDIVESLEEIRSGRPRRRPAVGPGSPLGLVSDAVHRLAHDVQAQQRESTGAAERWEALGDAAQQTAIITSDTDGDVRSFSSGATAVFGWDEDDVVSRPASLLFEESAYKELLPRLTRRSLRERGVTTRTRMLRRDGTSFPAEVTVRQLQGPAAQPRGFMMLVRDITEQIELENELRQSEARYRGLLEGLVEGVIMVRGNRVLYANRAAEELLGRSAKELLAAPLRGRIAARDVMVVEERLAAVEAGRSPGAEMDVSLSGTAGASGPQVRIRASRVELGGEPAVLLLLQDQTTARQIEAELRRNEARLDAVLEATSDGILVLAEGREGGVVQIGNRAFTELFHLRMEQLLALPEEALLRLLRGRGEVAGRVADVLATATAAAAPRRELVSIEGPPLRELQVAVAPLTDRQGRPLGRVLACRDLTDQRLSERQLQEQAEKLRLSKVELEQAYSRLNEANRQLKTRGEELDAVNRELRRLNEMKSNLLGDVSHELQTPLVSIRGYTEMTLKERLGPITEEQRRGLGLSLKSIDRLISMIDNLLAFSRMDAELGGLKLSRFHVGGLIREAGDMLREKLEAKGLALNVEIRGPDPELHADRDKVLQVLQNLLSNAIKYSRQSGRIHVVVGAGQPGYAAVRVRDFGVGIPVEAVGRIFDRHYQVRRPGATRPEGSGIGLAIVRDILRLHGCTIRVESQEGQGAEFIFNLPLAEELNDQREEHAVSEPEPPLPEPSADEPAPEVDAQAPPAASSRPRFRVIRRY